MWRFLYLVFCGFFLGLSALAPGISGSIVAIMMGIYQDLLSIVSNPFKEFKKNALFCLPVLTGIAFSIVTFILIFSFLFESFEKATYLLFVGLIAGNFPVVFKKARQHGFSKNSILSGSIAMIAAFTLAVLVIRGGHASGEEGLTAGLPLLMLSGLAAGAALPVPGMSFSMVLILFGVYGQLIDAGKSLIQGGTDLLVPVGAFTVCIVTGLVLASRLIKAVFESYPALAKTTVLGFVSGSLGGMLVQSLRMEDPGFIWWHGAAALAAGLGLSALFTVLSRDTGN